MSSRPSMFSRPMLGQHVMAALVAFAVVAPLAMFAADRVVPVERVKGVMTPGNPVPGERVRVVWDAKFNRACDARVTRTIVDSTGTIWNLSSSDPEYGRHFEIVRWVHLPMAIAWGPARYRAVVRYVCNPLHRVWPIVVEGPEVVFHVSPPPQ